MPVTDCSARGSDNAGAIAVISSAGGIPALLEMLPAFPARFQLPVFIAQHLPPTAASVLTTLLGRRCVLDVGWATDGHIPAAGKVYVVRPGDVLRIERGRMAVSAQERHWRGWLNAADILLHSVAEAYAEAAIGVVLSGMMPVGIAGLNAIRRTGGVLIAQSKMTSLCFEMPAAACDLARAEVVLPPGKIAGAVCAMTEFKAA